MQTEEVTELSDKARKEKKVFVRRYGEAYGSACACGSLLYTSDDQVLGKWRGNHALHGEEVSEL